MKLTQDLIKKLSPRRLLKWQVTKRGPGGQQGAQNRHNPWCLVEGNQGIQEQSPGPLQARAVSSLSGASVHAEPPSLLLQSHGVIRKPLPV